MLKKRHQSFNLYSLRGVGSTSRRPGQAETNSKSECFNDQNNSRVRDNISRDSVWVIRVLDISAGGDFRISDFVLRISGLSGLG